MDRRKAIQSLMVVPGALLFQERAQAGGQLEEPLADSVRTALSSAIANDAPPVPVFASTEARLAYLRWLSGMSDRVNRGFADQERAIGNVEGMLDAALRNLGLSQRKK